MNRLITLLIFNLGFSQVFNTSQGTEYSTIGEALQNVNSGDVIQVSPGTYVESISIETPINIEGSPGSIIDASKADLISAGSKYEAGFTMAPIE